MNLMNLSVFTPLALFVQPGPRGKLTHPALSLVVRATALNTEHASTDKLVKRVAKAMPVAKRSVRQATNVLFGLSGESGQSVGSLAARVRLSAVANASMVNQVILDARETMLRPKYVSARTENVHRGVLGAIYHHVP